MEKISRRHLPLILGGLGGASVWAQSPKQHGTTIHQEVDFKVPPTRIYEILLDAKLFSACTKDSAEIQPRVGEPFKLFGGRIEGRNIELVSNQRLVQAWRPAYWPAGVYSMVKFELLTRGFATRVVLDQAGFTADKWEGLNAGWSEHYWEPLHKYLKG